MKKVCKLNYIQVMMLLHKLEEIKKEIAGFNDEIADSFESYAVNRTKEIAIDSISTKLFHISNYIVSRSTVNHLMDITGVNVFDKDAVKDFAIYYNTVLKKELVKPVYEKTM